jgi:hypothetical protein
MAGHVVIRRATMSGILAGSGVRHEPRRRSRAPIIVSAKEEKGLSAAPHCLPQSHCISSGGPEERTMSSSKNYSGTEEVCTTLPADVLNGLDALVAARPETVSRGEAVRHILREWLQARGYMRDPEAVEGVKPEDLSSANDG